MAAADRKSPNNLRNPPKSATPKDRKKGGRVILSPRFRSAAAMAGWDEEALLLATLVVEITPVRGPPLQKEKRLKSSASTNSARRRKPRRQSRVSIPPVVLRLDDEEDGGEKIDEEDGKAMVDKAKESDKEGALAETASSKSVPRMERLREELSCAICSDICFEPSTTPCGHSFCIKCLKCAATECGKQCPKCRQLISNGRSCTINTVLWSTIQLLFPDEVEARKKSTVASPSPACSKSIRSGAATQASQVTERGRRHRRRFGPARSGDAAMLLRQQGEREQTVALQGALERRLRALHAAHANLRIMVSRGFYGPTRRRAT